MASEPMRSFIKGVIWETGSFILTFGSVYVIYGNFLSSLKFSVVLTTVKIMLFFIHERLWKKVRWGKYHIVGGKKVFEKKNKKAGKGK